MKSSIHVGVVAPCSPVGQIELDFGMEFLRQFADFVVHLHPQCAQQHFIWAGTDQDRAAAFWQYANDPDIDVIWSARGGYGATRILPLLEQLTQTHSPPPPKLLVGYSDVTVLHEFVRRRWRWHTLHAPMLASNLRALKPEEWHAILGLVRRQRPPIPWDSTQLRFLTSPPPQPIRGELIGGNLSLWTALAGTPWQPDAHGKLLFFEDLSERPYRIDRMVTQIAQARMLDGVAGIILGDFTDCQDENVTVLALPPDQAARARLQADWSAGLRVPLRPVYSPDEALKQIFGTVGSKLGIPVAAGLPVGHGPNFSPLPLGAQYELTPNGQLRLLEWSYLTACGNHLH
ncbi:S66 peptidase family protein [Fontivita pretiosa]|uniref:S66 peptidase family protein n=1 Tax=Fontivita pretiosa TaxID=2989684 RepID=UPI003D169B59